MDTSEIVDMAYRRERDELDAISRPVRTVEEWLDRLDMVRGFHTGLEGLEGHPAYKAGVERARREFQEGAELRGYMETWRTVRRAVESGQQISNNGQLYFTGKEFSNADYISHIVRTGFDRTISK